MKLKKTKKTEHTIETNEQICEKYQKFFTESSIRQMKNCEKFFANKEVRKIILDEFKYKDADPIDALHIACCQIMIAIANADDNFSKEEEDLIYQVTGIDVDPEKAKNFACNYFVNGDGVPLIVGYACFIEQYYLRTEGRETNAVRGVELLFERIISATAGADGKHSILETFCRLDVTKGIKKFLEDYQRTKKAGYLVWAFGVQ
jgi:hypothetical protein